MMKKTLIIAIGLSFFFAQVLLAEESLDFEHITEKFTIDKKKIVENNMVLTKKEAKNFWPLFEEYQNQLSAIDGLGMKLIEDYFTAAEKMKEHQAKLIIENYLENEDKRLTLKKAYVPKLRKVLPAEKVVTYFYLETKIEAMKRLQIFQMIPLIY